MATMKLAVPTLGQPGLDSERSGHFGHCDCFTLITIEDGQITEVAAIDNPPHEEGGCLRRWGCCSRPVPTPLWLRAWACAR